MLPWRNIIHFWNPKLICCTKYDEIRLSLSQTLDKNIIGPNQRLILNSRKYLNWIVLQQQLTQGIIHLVRTQNFPKNIISYPLIRTRKCVHQWVRNVSFSGESWIRLANLPLDKFYPPWKEEIWIWVFNLNHLTKKLNHISTYFYLVVMVSWYTWPRYFPRKKLPGLEKPAFH